jgi:hypothetical protein
MRRRGAGALAGGSAAPALIACIIKVRENNLAGELGVGVKLPVKIHLENPVLGQNCFVGSSAAPIKWELTMGETSPPAPNTPIKGSFGAVEFLEEALMLESKGAKLVDNAWAAPAATGCGGIFASSSARSSTPSLAPPPLGTTRRSWPAP